ncbi:uncharacterized G-patch domain protein DDB_G0278987-like isoform X1 [Macrosteles quadrilineatus]|uniref:uncharacterized G-patch domain protein DDB_G0278987-like isoform X1 n=1 Tax=Macrosteles quadrilineatus TaxID=74068 RepID=UPI0023E2CE56|nr:uncharacterized G-patch domain protein DDB_G0278987-like isoform X1 [Macrosteles quadrilineatus]
MPVCEKIKSIVCTPTHKCCEILCTKCKTLSHTSSKSVNIKTNGQQSKTKILFEKIQPKKFCGTKENREENVSSRKPTRRDLSHVRPKVSKEESSDSDSSGEEPVEPKWKTRKPSFFPQHKPSKKSDQNTPNEETAKSKRAPKGSKVSNQNTTDSPAKSKRTRSTLSNKNLRDKDPVKGKWANKNKEVYSALTSNPTSSQYWVQSNLQYIIVLPMVSQRRNSPKISPPPPSPPDDDLDDSEEEKPKSQESSESEDSSILPAIEKPKSKESSESEDSSKLPAIEKPKSQESSESEDSSKLPAIEKPKSQESSESADSSKDKSDKSSESKLSFEPRSNAQLPMPQKTKGFCCVKKQNSG